MTPLKEGDVIDIQVGMKVYANVPKHFLYGNQKGNFTLDHVCVKIGGETAYLAGRYVVFKTSNDGGGQCGPNDSYPNGHHVFCERVDDRGVKLDFYQSGCFTAMIEDITPVGKATRQWVFESEKKGGKP